MKVVYKKTMISRISDARHEARYLRREIEKIVITVPEARELLDELGCSLPMPGEMMHWRSDFEWWLHKAELLAAHRDDIRIGDQPMLKVMGIDIKVSR